MKYTCPKCGKKMELSTEVLINSEYKVICPQCLCQLQIIGDYAYIPSDDLKLDTTIKPSSTINCPVCGREASNGTHFCPYCGTSFDTPAPPPVPTDGDTPVEDVTVLPPPIPNGDPLYNEAVKFLMTCNAITPMMLRDRFNISNERAAELIRQLEAGGVIGPYNNGGPRQILIPHKEFYSYTTPSSGIPGSGTPTGQGRPQPRRLGCFSWLLIAMFFMLVMKTCGF